MCSLETLGATSWEHGSTKRNSLTTENYGLKFGLFVGLACTSYLKTLKSNPQDDIYLFTEVVRTRGHFSHHCQLFIPC
jgi:hypothetical protein